MVEQTLITLLSGGHALLIGVPGLAKSGWSRRWAIVLGLDDKRVQFTPDLMPADILGTEVLDEDADGRRVFRFIPGPVFCQLLMADEINRASPRTQSALLQAMQEQRVSVAGVEHPLPRPFHVLATQNPIEQEGTYPLPEAQLDRFLLQIDVSYPDLDAERRMLIATTGPAEAKPVQAMTRRGTDGGAGAGAPRAGRRERGRRDPEAGARRPAGDRPTTRRSASTSPGARARAPPGADAGLPRAAPCWTAGWRPVVDDVVALAPPVLRHRMALNFAARADGVVAGR